MPGLLTEVTEITTGLGMLGLETLGDALRARPPSMRNVTPEHWDRLHAALAAGEHRDAFDHAWANGRAFLQSPDGLRGRPPLEVEWKGPHQPPGFDFLPADLRADHVYLISCKYQSRILANSSPANLFLRRLADRGAASQTESWYTTCAPGAYERFYSAVRRYVGLERLPASPQELLADDVARIRSACGGTWPGDLLGAWAEFSFAISSASARLWADALPTLGRREEMLWRLLRLNPAPYFILGATDAGPLRLRIGTPWDWRQDFVLRAFEIEATTGGQPRVAWVAHATERTSGELRRVAGHVEVRWAHGRFSSVEAKVYLDTPHDTVPGYHPLGDAGA